MTGDIDQVVALERKFWTSANDPSHYREAMADDCINVMEPMGFVTKAQAVEYAASGKPYEHIAFKDLIAQQPTPDCITLAYHGEGTVVGGDKPYRGSIASVYSRRGGLWQMTLTVHQALNTEPARTK